MIRLWDGVMDVVMIRAPRRGPSRSASYGVGAFEGSEDSIAGLDFVVAPRGRRDRSGCVGAVGVSTIVGISPVLDIARLVRSGRGCRRWLRRAAASTVR